MKIYFDLKLANQKDKYQVCCDDGEVLEWHYFEVSTCYPIIAFIRDRGFQYYMWNGESQIGPLHNLYLVTK